MQFIEKNSFNVRAAVYHLGKGNEPLHFILFPMIHIESKQYYEEVSRRLSECDLVLMEGVDSRKADYLTLSYRVVKRIRRMELVTQQEALKIRLPRKDVINADMSRRDFDKGWSAVSAALRFQLIIFLPVYVVWLFLFGTREVIAEHMAMEDMPSRDETLFSDEDTESLDRLLIDERDRQLIGVIEDLHRTKNPDRKTVGIVYGARHMRNITSFLLDRLSYRITASDWVVVFDL